MQFLDTNILIRYLTKDPPDQAARAYNLLKQVETGTRQVAITEAIVTETVHVLSSKTLYNVPRHDIRTHLTTILGLRGLKIAHKRTYLRALDLYASTNLDFVDALIVAHMERVKATILISFDRDFDHIPGITRNEP